MNWIAFLLILWGNISVGNKRKYGFIFIALGSVIWLLIGLRLEDYALVLTNATGIIIMMRNWFKWKAENNKKP